MTIITFAPVRVGHRSGMLKVEFVPKADELRYDVLVKTTLNERVTISLKVDNATYSPEITDEGLVFADVMVDGPEHDIRLIADNGLG